MMNGKYVAIGLLSVVMLVLLWMNMAAEGFSSARDTRGKVIFDWFKSHPKGTYKEFAKDTRGDFLEFETGKAHQDTPNFTAENLGRLL